jgi:hypothetical protein
MRRGEDPAQAFAKGGDSEEHVTALVAVNNTTLFLLSQINFVTTQ